MAEFRGSYAGIGSREITVGEHMSIQKVASILSDARFLLYSGNAPGADQAFQFGSKGKCMVYLPWAGFEQQAFDYTEAVGYAVVGRTQPGIDSISKYHPNPASLSSGAKALMSRNYHQVHGIPPEYPQVKFVLCCADPLPNGGVSGGTGQAVRIAMDIGVPIINIRVDGWNQLLKDVIKRYC